jgi:hypothetical protein
VGASVSAQSDNDGGDEDSTARPARRRRLNRLYLLLAATFCVFALCEVYVGWSQRGWFSSFDDYNFNMDVARRWLADGSYFIPRQLAGPHLWQVGEVLYPPVSLWLFVPFSFLPAAVWFAIPLAVIVAALWRLRPIPAALAIIAMMLCEPDGLVEFVNGNPILWVVAIEFAALAWRVPASLALFKPSLFPFAVAGIWARRWWVAVGLLALLSAPFLQLDLTWVRVVLDTHGRGGLFYNGSEIPYALIPYIAWFGSSGAAAIELRETRPVLTRLLPSLVRRLSDPTRIRQT